MTKTEIKNSILASLDKYGLMPYPEANVIKSTTEFYLLCDEFRLLLGVDIINYEKSLDCLWVKDGLLCRYPESHLKDELEQHDDYVSVACSCGIDASFCKFSKSIFYYGLKHFFHYANVKPKSVKEWFSCFRQPYEITIFALCGGIRTSLISFASLIGIVGLLQLWGAIIIEAYKPKENTSGKLLMWQLSKAIFPFKFLITIPLWIFNRKVNQTEIFNIYYPEKQLAEFAKQE
jgi:hypothetical protein